MSAKTITVPSAGKEKRVSMQGLSLFVLSAPSYASPTEAAKISFDQPGQGYPAENGSVWPSPVGQFSEIIVTGTSESAGDEIVLFPDPNCHEVKLSGSDGASDDSGGIAGQTFSITSTDAAQKIPVERFISEGRIAKAMYITATGEGIIYAFKREPDRTGVSYFLPPADEAATTPVAAQMSKIKGIDFMRNFLFASAVPATPGELVITLEF